MSKRWHHVTGNIQQATCSPAIVVLSCGQQTCFKVGMLIGEDNANSIIIICIDLLYCTGPLTAIVTWLCTNRLTQ